MTTASAASATTTSSSKWKSKLQTRIENLSESSSAESIQTLGNWICFHRVKRRQDIVSCLCNLLLQNKVLSRKQLLVWKVIHSILIFEFSSSSKTTSSGASGGAASTTTRTRTTRMEQQQARLRSLIGESLPSVLEELGPSVPDVELLAFLKEWDSRQVFDSPTLMAQIWRIFKDRRSSSSSTGSGSGSNNQNNNNRSKAADADPTAEDTSTTTAAAPLAAAAAAATTIKVKVKKEEAEEEVEYEPMDADEEATAPSTPTTKDTSSVEMAKKEEDDHDMKPVDMTAATPITSTAAAAAATTTSSTIKEGTGAVPSSTSSATAPTTPAPVAVNVNTYDFDSKGVPEGQVLPSEFLEPCKAISTLQIARDVRSNPAMERSGLLSLLPKDIWSTCQQLHNNNEQQQQQGKTTAESDEDLVAASVSVLDDETTLDDYSKRIPSTLLDLDIDEELSSLELYQDIVERQTKAREKLIHLLLKSRCKFGAENAASFFYNDMQDPTIVDKLKKRKQVLQDALELEGADTVQIDQEEMAKKYNSHNKKRKTGSSSSSSSTAAAMTTTTTMDDGDDDLPPFEWYTTKKD